MTKETAIKLFKDRKITHKFLISSYSIRELRFERIGMKNKRNGTFLLLMLLVY